MRFGCLSIIIFLIVNLFIGSWSVIEILSWFGKIIPWGYSALIGFFAGEFTIPIAVIGKLLRICGVF